MQGHVVYAKVSPGGIEAINQLDAYITKCGLELSLIELVRLRSSQINGCGYCIDMHTKDARDEGESEQRLYGLSAWRESPFYSEREKAALAWTEAITKINEQQVPDEVYDRATKQFSEKELVDLTLAVIAINSWNRLSISFHTPIGSYHRNSPVTIRKAAESMRR